MLNSLKITQCSYAGKSYYSLHADIENIRKWTDLERVSGCRNAFLAQNTWVSRWIRVRNLHAADKKRPEGKGRKGKCQMLKNGKQ